MANEEHLGIIKQGVPTWNAWRESHPDIVPDVSYSNLGGAHLQYSQYRPADLPKSAWEEPVLNDPQLKGINLRRARIDGTYFGQAALQNANLRGAEGRRADFREADLQGADLSSAGIQESNFFETNLRDAVFEGYANFLRCSFRGADLRWARLRQAMLASVNFVGANLQHADLRESMLDSADFTNADLGRAKLDGADLRRAHLVNTNLEGSNLKGAQIYGISAWSLRLSGAQQSDLVITPRDEPAITVDNLEVAQFVYLLLHNEKIREIIDTIGEKGVLILGRFVSERKAVLDALRVKLRGLGFVPMMFDFEKPTQRDFTETIKTLAGMSRFIIADITNPRSSPLELQALMPDYMIPFVPIIHEGEEPFAMFRDLKQKYGNWVLDVLKYDSTDSLIDVLREAVIQPALEMSQALVLKKAEALRERHVKDYQKPLIP